MPVKGRRALPNQMPGWAYIGFTDARSAFVVGGTGRPSVCEGRSFSKPMGQENVNMRMRSIETYEWPEALFPLRDWMRRKGVDVDAMKSERQAYWMARTLGRQKTKFTNDRSKSLFPYMLKIQRSLCPNERGGKAPIRREPYVAGTFGAASEVRHIDPAEYLAGKNSPER